MGPRRSAIAALATALALAGPACTFSRNSNELPTTSTAVTVEALTDDTSTSVEDTTTTIVDTSTTRPVATTVRHTAQATTRPPAPRPATTARPAPATPHCNVSAGDTFYGGSWTASVTSTFPNATVVLDLSWGTGNAGNYSGVTDPGGSYVKTQRVQPSMRNQTVNVRVSVGGRTCSTSFRVS